MTKQNTVTLNLTKQEAECLAILFEKWSNDTMFIMDAGKPCKPFINKLKAKINAHQKQK